jgi:general secretion pathway protein D
MRFDRAHPIFTALLLTFATAHAVAQRAQPPPASSPAQAQQQAQAPQPAQAQQPVQGQPPAQQPMIFNPAPRVAPELPLVELAPLLQRVERESNKRFLVDGSVSPRIFLGGVEADDVDYPVLLSILRANGLAAVEIEGRVNIVRDSEVRFLPAPMVQNDDASIAADEWVTRIVTVTNIEAPFLIPILRPLLPQAAHLAGFAPDKIIIMDRYANVQRITAIIRSLDVPPRD